MKSQYCKVGTVKPINSGEHSNLIIEGFYRDFIDKSSNIEYANTKLGEFFETKAQQFEKLLNSL